MEKLIYPKVVKEPSSYLEGWVGLACLQIIHRENDWYFDFEGRGSISAECPWRILDSGCVAHADEDDGQRFGLPEPVKGAERALMLLAGKRITSVAVAPVSGDLKVHFGNGTTLEFLVNSSGYESWNASAGDAQHRTYLVAQGGGQISMREDEA